MLLATTVITNTPGINKHRNAAEIGKLNKSFFEQELFIKQ